MHLRESIPTDLAEAWSTGKSLDAGQLEDCVDGVLGTSLYVERNPEWTLALLRALRSESRQQRSTRTPLSLWIASSLAARSSSPSTDIEGAVRRWEAGKLEACDLTAIRIWVMQRVERELERRFSGEGVDVAGVADAQADYALECAFHDLLWPDDQAVRSPRGFVAYLTLAARKDVVSELRRMSRLPARDAESDTDAGGEVASDYPEAAAAVRQRGHRERLSLLALQALQGAARPSLRGHRKDRIIRSIEAGIAWLELGDRAASAALGKAFVQALDTGRYEPVKGGDYGVRGAIVQWFHALGQFKGPVQLAEAVETERRQFPGLQEEYRKALRAIGAVSGGAAFCALAGIPPRPPVMVPKWWSSAGATLAAAIAILLVVVTALPLAQTWTTSPVRLPADPTPGDAGQAGADAGGELPASSGETTDFPIAPGGERLSSTKEAVDGPPQVDADLGKFAVLKGGNIREFTGDVVGCVSSLDPKARPTECLTSDCRSQERRRPGMTPHCEDRKVQYSPDVSMSCSRTAVDPRAATAMGNFVSCEHLTCWVENHSGAWAPVAFDFDSAGVGDGDPRQLQLWVTAGTAWRGFALGGRGTSPAYTSPMLAPAQRVQFDLDFGLRAPGEETCSAWKGVTARLVHAGSGGRGSMEGLTKYSP